MKTKKIVHYVSTALFSVMLLMGVGMYFFNYPHVSGEFGKLGFPVWVIYPLAIVKLLGVIALWFKGLPKVIREWAYAGFFFNLVLAFTAHVMIGDGEQFGALAAIVLLIISRYTFKSVNG